MKIAIVVKSFPTVSETFIVNQIIGFIEAGHEVEILSIYRSKDKVLHHQIKKHDLLNKVRSYNDFTSDKFRSLLSYLNFLVKNWRIVNIHVFLELLFKIIRQKQNRLLLLERTQWFVVGKKYDIVHAHFGNIASRFIDIKKFKSLSATKFFISFHGYDLSPDQISLNSLRYKDLLMLSDGFIVNTEYLKSILYQVKGDINRISVIPVGLNTKIFVPDERAKIKNSILFCGRLIALKAPDLAIKIIEKVKKSIHDVQLSIIGEGPLEQEVKRLVSELNLDKNVRFYGACTQEEVKGHMNANMLFLLPGIEDPNTGRAETQGLVIQEAQAMGLPVLVSDAGGMRYGLIDGETGFILPRGDVDLFANKIIKLLNNPCKIKSMGYAARSFVQKNYDIESIVKKHLEKFLN